LQTFPDTYIFKGKRTTGGIRRAGNPQKGNFDREVPKYTQIGNAVPVKLAEAVAKHFDSLLVKAGF
jgi:DNA (cytosine-5)-methyltransferase 1